MFKQMVYFTWKNVIRAFTVNTVSTCKQEIYDLDLPFLVKSIDFHLIVPKTLGLGTVS